MVIGKQQHIPRKNGGFSYGDESHGRIRETSTWGFPSNTTSAFRGPSPPAFSPDGAQILVSWELPNFFFGGTAVGWDWLRLDHLVVFFDGGKFEDQLEVFVFFKNRMCIH